MTDLVQPGEVLFSLMPRNFSEAMEFAKVIADTDFVPKDFRGKPGNILVAVQMGAEVGLKPIQALQNIAVINGRPSIWGDALWALINSHPLCEWTKESFDDSTMTAICTVKRKNRDAVVRIFSKADAERANLWTKDGPWKQYPKRMLQMRARGFACRDSIPEALKGMSLREEAEDSERDMGEAQVVRDEPLEMLATALPASKSERVDTETGEVLRDQPKDDAPALVTPGALAVINKKLVDKQLHEAFCKHYAIADPSELPRSKVNGALEWIDAQVRRD